MWNQGRPYPFYAVSVRWSIISKVRKRVGYRGPLPNHWQLSVRSEWYDTVDFTPEHFYYKNEEGGGVFSFFELFTPPSHSTYTCVPFRGEAKKKFARSGLPSPPEAPDRQKTVIHFRTHRFFCHGQFLYRYIPDNLLYYLVRKPNKNLARSCW